ncbi:MAG: hypothetical protein Q8P42_00045 [Gallionella sp.]|nr:hypothetical protein [Gallionella sp.]
MLATASKPILKVDLRHCLSDQITTTKDNALLNGRQIIAAANPDVVSCRQRQGNLQTDAPKPLQSASQPVPGQIAGIYRQFAGHGLPD